MNDVIKETSHIHKWSQHLYNPEGRYWFQVCEGTIKVRRKDALDRREPCRQVERWTTIKDRKDELSQVKDERQELELWRRAKRD